MKRLLFFALASVLFMSPSLSCDAATYKKMTIRAATANPEGSLHATAINKFKEIIERESGGAIKVQTFYGGSMGDEQANVKQLRDGEIQLAVLAGGNLTPFAPRAGAFILPYIFPHEDDAKKVFTNAEYMQKSADEIAQQSRTRPLAWLLGGYRHITNSKRPITKMEDMQGLKIRVPVVELQIEAFHSWGVSPHPLAWSETFNALQQGVADGQETPYSVIRDQKFWEVQKYITPLHYQLFIAPMLVSEIWYKKLDPDTKALVDKAAMETAAYEWKWMEEEDTRALNQCLEKGMVVTELTDEPKWMEAARGIWPKFYDKVGGKAAVDEMLVIMSK